MLATYLHALATIRATGAATPETSYYTPLENLLNAAGAQLKPAVRAVFQLNDLGAGRPDFGLFAASQFERPADGSAVERRAGALPERGAGEVKGPADALDELLHGKHIKQVSKYWARYRQVLVTNLRQFAFISENEQGQPLVLDTFELAATEAGFWALCHAPTPPPRWRPASRHFWSAACATPRPSTSPRTWPGFWPPLPAKPGSASRTATPPACANCVRRWKKPWACASRARRAGAFCGLPWCRRSFMACSAPGCCGTVIIPATRAARPSAGATPPTTCSCP